jgi:Tfp pilus assembly protein PilV
MWQGRLQLGRSRRDAGTGLIEIVISITLLGISVTAMLAALTTTIKASAVERDHANAHAWLQTASDVLYGLDRVDCGTQGSPQEVAVRTSYETDIKAIATNPEGWPADRIAIVPPVLFWDGNIYQNDCYDDENLALQLITIEVRNPADEIVETVEVVKG